MPTQILLTTFGSAGDVNPFICLGREMQRRGYAATLITNPHFENAVHLAGLDFIPVGTEAFYEMLTSHPDVWHPSKGPLLLAEQGLAQVLRPLYDVLRQFDPAQTVVVGSSAALAARIMQEQFGMPLITVYNQPAYLFSVYETPRISGLPWLDKAPRSVKRWMLSQITRVLQKITAPAINTFRTEIGLSPLADVTTWTNSPDRIIGLFPEWFAPPQPDWPQQTALTGFVLYDGPQNQVDAHGEALPEGLRNFLDAGLPPIVFTLGTAMRQSRQFFEESIEVCKRLGRRGVLVTQYRDQIPAELPENVYYASHAPFGALFRRAAALVYSGGIGTLSQALAAGIPHLVVPMSHDQPDNAARIERLGIGTSLPLKNYRSARAARKLEALLNSSTVTECCQVVAGRLNAEEAIHRTCDLIEEQIPAEVLA